MTGPRTLLGIIPDEMVQEQLASVGRYYGIALTGDVVAQMASDISNDLASAGPRRVQIMEDAILSHLREANPVLANEATAMVEGRRLWEALDLDHAELPLRPDEIREGSERTGDLEWVPLTQRLRVALDECRQLSGTERTERFHDIVERMAEMFRVRQGEGDGPLANLLGQTYDIFASDTQDVYRNDQLNCFSGTIALGLAVSYAARYVGMEDEVTTAVRQVASYNLGGSRWDDTGHAILQVRIAGENLFFDSTNAMLDWQASRFEFIPGRNFLHTTRGRSCRYYLGASFSITGHLLHAARLQDRLLHSREPPGAATVRQIAGMPPLFMSYFIENMEGGRRAEFLRTMGVAGMRRIASPAERYRLAATAAVLFRHSEPALARSFGTIALRALEEAVAGSEAVIGSLPMGGFLERTVQLADMMGETPEGNALIRSSRIWAYIPLVAARSAETIEPSVARTALNFMTRFHAANRQLIERQTDLATFNLLRGLLRLQTIAGSMPSRFGRGTDAPSPRWVASELYIMIGVDMNAALESLRRNAGLELPRTSGDNAARTAMLFATDPIAQQLEEEFLRAVYQVMNGTFSLENIRIGRVRLSARGRVVADALLATFQPSSLRIILAEGSELRRRAEEEELV